MDDTDTPIESEDRSPGKTAGKDMPGRRQSMEPSLWYSRNSELVPEDTWEGLMGIWETSRPSDGC